MLKARVVGAEEKKRKPQKQKNWNNPVKSKINRHAFFPDLPSVSR